MIRLWRFNRITGYWTLARSVTAETAAQWLAIFQQDEPAESFIVSKRKPS